MTKNVATSARTRIFISYRREDSAGWTRGLVADLARALPEHRVFHDIAAIEVGEDFVDAIRRELIGCAVVLVVIGPHWLRVNDEAGRRRLDDPEDFVRLEVAECLQRSGLRVVPVLVGAANMPRAVDLPEPLRMLARRNAHEISDKRWEYDVAQLVAVLKRIVSHTGVVSSPVATTAVPPSSVIAGDPTVPPGTLLGTASVFRDSVDCPEMVIIPAGEFVMGSPESEQGRSNDEGPQHVVRIAQPFALGRFELTVAEFARFAVDTGYKTEGERSPQEGIAVYEDRTNQWVYSQGKSWRDPGFEQGKDHPVVGVSWNDAIAYAKWLSEQTGKVYRLPSEAEWEYAARAGTNTARFWGDNADEAYRYANVADRRLNARFPNWPWTIHECDDGFAETAPVGSFEPNPFALYDMIGNVWEWVQDCWNDSYQGAPADGRPWESCDCSLRVLRGGCWLNSPRKARAADRIRNRPGYRVNSYGFRVARTL